MVTNLSLDYLSDDQSEAVEKIKEWYLSDSREFYLSGVAGTGKSSLISLLPDVLGIDRDLVKVLAYTGKAAMVLRSKGVDASTIHSLIYRMRRVSYRTRNRWRFVRYDTELVSVEDKIEADLVIIDEASMVGSQVLEDLRKLYSKILLVGDHGQLPPTSSDGFEAYSRLQNPDYKLTQIHRQAKGNPIIRLSELVRTGRKLAPISIGSQVRVVKLSEFDTSEFKFYDQVICPTNRIRKEINSEVRESLGISSQYPVVGDKVVSISNNYEISHNGYFLCNGMTGYVTSVVDDQDELVGGFEFESPELGFYPRRTLTYYKGFFDPSKSWEDHNDFISNNEGLCQFDYGYALTVHKSQGSQWSRVLIYDDGSMEKYFDYKKMMYTAITRAIDQVTIVCP